MAEKILKNLLKIFWQFDYLFDNKFALRKKYIFKQFLINWIDSNFPEYHEIKKSFFMENEFSIHFYSYILVLPRPETHMHFASKFF